MRLTPRGWATVTLFAVLFGFAVGLLAPWDRAPWAPPTEDSGTIPPVVCVEDMGCWDCTTMGNRRCGP